MTKDHGGLPSAAGLVLQPILGKPELGQRQNAAVQHLLAAAMFARAAEDLENRHTGQALGPFFDQIRANVSASIIMSVAALEANLNELLDDLGADRSVLEKVKRDDLTKQYEAALLRFTGEQLDLSRRPGQSVRTLIRFRNQLVHWWPEWDHRQQAYAKLGHQLRSEGFELSPFFGKEEAKLFPNRVMSHGCAAWAVNSSLKFAEEVSIRLSGKPKFEPFAKHMRVST